MKAVLVAVFSLAASALALATPVITTRQLEAQTDEIDKLTELVMVHTANINKTTAAVQDNPTTEQQNAAAAALAPDLQAITSALTSATSTLAKRAVAGASGVRSRSGCSHDCLLAKVQLLVWEIGCTLKFVIVKLGLACVLDYLKPLLIALVGLIKALDKVIVGVLVVVKSLLTALLGAVAGLLLELIW